MSYKKERVSLTCHNDPTPRPQGIKSLRFDYEEVYVGQSSFYRLADFEKAFNDIRADRKELHRLKDTLRHQKHRKRKKAQRNVVSQIEQMLLKDCGTKTTTGGKS